MSLTPVLLVSASSVAGGSQRGLASLASRLPAHGFAPFAVLLQEGILEEWLREADCPFALVPAGRLRQVNRALRTVRALHSFSDEIGARVVVTNETKGHVYGGAAALTAHLPAVWWQRGLPSRTSIDRVAARIPAAAVVCGSDAVIAAQRRLTPRRRLVKIRPGIPVAKIAGRRGTGSEVRKKLGLEGTPLVGIVGRLQPWKGHDLFLRAAALVAATHPEVRFLVVGGAVLGWEGSYPEDLHRLASDLGLAEQVVFAGHQDDVYPWFDALDVVVHASLNEPFGLVIVEAMALGKPVLAAREGGPLEIVEDGVSGLLFERKPDHLAAAICRVLDKPDLSKQLASGGLTRAWDFSEERLGARFAELLADVAGDTRWRGA